MTRLIHHCIDRYRGTVVISQEELEAYAEQVIDLYQTILDSGGVVRKKNDLYYTEVLPGLLLCDLIYDAAEIKLSPDCLYNFRRMIDQSPPLEECHVNEASISGTIGLYKSENDNSLSVGTDWMHFVRDDLTNNLRTVEAFYADFTAAFPRLKFSSGFPNCLNSFDGGHLRFTATITRCLSNLNDDWNHDGRGDLPLMLRAFSSKSNCTTTLEGNGERKEALTFKFSLGAEHSEQVLCEPHMKLEHSDDLCGNFFHRIYFCPRQHAKFEDKILVGHVGKHL